MIGLLAHNDLNWITLGVSIGAGIGMAIVLMLFRLGRTRR
jgi:hypothetical protein